MHIALYSIGLYFHHQSYPQLGVVFALALPFHSFWSYFSTLSSSILGTYQPRDFIFQCHTFLLFHTVHGVLKAKILKWLPIPFSSGPRFVEEFSAMTHASWVALHSMAHIFTELDKDVVHVINLVSFL